MEESGELENTMDDRTSPQQQQQQPTTTERILKKRKHNMPISRHSMTNKQTIAHNNKQKQQTTTIKMLTKNIYTE
jgi:hypothetical protein